MKNLINTASNAIGTTVLFAVGAAMAGMGLALIGVLAIFALAATGLAFLAAPFVSLMVPATADADTSEAA